jgi:hypothetical protein
MWLNGLSIARGNPQLGFELMNGEKPLRLPQSGADAATSSPSR